MATLTDHTEETEAVLAHHLQSFGALNVDAILADYADDAVLYTPDGPLRGPDQIRGFFTRMIDNLPDGFLEGMEMVRQDVEDDRAYIVWRSSAGTPLGTDTFLLRDGKIAFQTFAAYNEA